jgi:eukaryotic-like serine/threonine-protein kinase
LAELEMTMMKTRMDSETFLAHVRQSGLIPAEKLGSAMERLAPTERGKTVARALVKMGLLTKFQAELLLIGRSTGFVLGQYRILDQLGEGGMGRVFKAEHMTMGRTVALKVLAPRHTKTEKAKRLFMREVRAAGKLMHPNIVAAHDAHDATDGDGRHYLVMEYIDGPNLDQLVRERGPLPVGLACDIVRQVAAGLQCAHEHGMVHRDIKPSNVLLQRAGTALTSGYVVKIVDFGLACLGASVPGPESVKNVIMGTPDYLSPEQASNQNTIDIRADLYSLGCTFYFLLTGRAPFPGGTPAEKLARHTQEEPAAIEQLRPDVPQEVADIVRCLMAKEPARRFQTPADLVLELMPLAVPVPSAWATPNILPIPAAADTVELAPNTGFVAAVEDPAKTGSDDGQMAIEMEDPETVSLSELDVELLLLAERNRRSHKAGISLSILAGALFGAAVTAGLLLFLR